MTLAGAARFTYSREQHEDFVWIVLALAGTSTSVSVHGAMHGPM